MDYGTINLASTLRALSSMQDTIANNIANVASTGFKRRQGAIVPFESEMARANGQREGVSAFQEFPDLEQGDLIATGNKMDTALQGDGFLMLARKSDPDNVFYSRGGSLARSSEGELVTKEGYLVLGEDRKPIELGDEGNILIRNSGEIISGRTGDRLSSLGVYRFDKPDALQSLGAGLYRETPATGEAIPDRFTQVVQGSLERSNVNSVMEMVSMISTQRHFGAITRALHTVNQITSQLFQMAQS